MGVLRPRARQTKRGHEAVQRRATLEIDQVPVEGKGQALAGEVADVSQRPVRTGEDPLVLVEPGDPDHRSLGAVGARPDGRDVPPFAEETGELVMIVRVADGAVV